VVLVELIVIAGIGLTVTVTLAVLEQPKEFVPVTIYVVVVLGLAVTAAPVVVLSPPAGDQE